MTRKRWFYVFSGLLILSIAVFCSFRYAQDEDNRNVRGQHVFAQTRENMGTLQQIHISAPQSGIKFTVYLSDDNIWRIKELSDYFASPSMLAEFYAMVNNSLIMKVSEGNEKLFSAYSLFAQSEKYPSESVGTVVETYDKEGNLLDKVVIGRAEENSEYYFARKEESSFIYSINKVNGFSGEPGAWLPFPLLEIHRSIITSVERNGVRLNDDVLEAGYLQSAKVKEFLRTLSFIGYQNIVTKKKFAERLKEAELHSLSVETVVGLVYVLDVYKIDDKYWLGVTLKSTRVSKKEVPGFISENQKYFENWLFQLSDDDGKVLYNSAFKLPQK